MLRHLPVLCLFSAPSVEAWEFLSRLLTPLISTHQWRKVVWQNIAVNCSGVCSNSSWVAVLLPVKLADVLMPRGGMSQSSHLEIIGDHLHKVAAIFVLNIRHLFVHLLHGHAAPEESPLSLSPLCLSCVNVMLNIHHLQKVQRSEENNWNNDKFPFVSQVKQVLCPPSANVTFQIVNLLSPPTRACLPANVHIPSFWLKFKVLHKICISWKLVISVDSSRTHS